MLYRLTMIGMLAGGLLAGGCQTDVRPLAGQPDPIAVPYQDPRISVADPQLQQWLGFHAAVMVRNGKMPMSITVPVRNLADDQYQIDYRFLFFDELDRQMDPVMNWRFAAVQPKAVAHLEASALDSRARNWKLEVKWANR